MMRLFFMSKSFLFFASDAVPAGSVASAAPVAKAIEPPPPRESLRILVIGSRRGVTSTIQTLHQLRFAEVHDWSPLLPGANPGEVMSILTRYLLLE
jgi:hypothetical protein